MKIEKNWELEFDDLESKLLLKKEENGPNFRNLFVGRILAFLSGLAYTIQNAIVANEEISFSDALVVRYVFTIIIVFAVVKILVEIKICRKNDFYENSVFKMLWINEVDLGQNINLIRGILIFQGIFAGSCILSDFHCVSNMPLGDASAIILSAPLPSMVLSSVFLGTRLRLFKIICGALLYCGVVLVIRPPFLFLR